VARQHQTISVLSIVLWGLFVCDLAPTLVGQSGEKRPDEPNILKDFLAGPMAGVDEIIFACRQLNYDPHWYANFGYYADTNNQDYQTILALCVAGKNHLDKIKRFDMPDFRPVSPYVREMKKYGIIPENLAADVRIDVYATDRAYWQSLWYKPENIINQSK